MLKARLNKGYAYVKLGHLSLRYIFMPHHSLSRIEFGQGLKIYAPNLFAYIQQKRHASLEKGISREAANAPLRLYATKVEKYFKEVPGEHLLHWSCETLEPFFKWVDHQGPIVHLLYLKEEDSLSFERILAYTETLEGSVLCILETDREGEIEKIASPRFLSLRSQTQRSQKTFFLPLDVLYNFSPPLSLPLNSEMALYFLLHLLEPVNCHIFAQAFFQNFTSLLPPDFFPQTTILEGRY